MEGPARKSLKPCAHLEVLVGGVVVEHGVDDRADRHLSLDGVEEADERLMAMTLHTAAKTR